MNSHLRKRLTLTFLSCIIAGLCWNAPITAQGGANPYLTGPSHRIDWNVQATGGGHLGRSWSGDLNADDIEDVVFMQNSRPVLMFGPDRYQAGKRLYGVCKDASVVYDRGRGRHVTLVADDAGLTLCVLHPVTGEVSTQLIAQGPWTDVQWFRARTEESTGDCLVLGLKSDSRTTVLARFPVNSDWTPVPLPSHSLPNDGLDAAFVDWDGDGRLEVAVQTTARVRLFERYGAAIGNLNQPAVEGSLLPFSEALRSGERLAWVLRPNQSPVQVLVIADSEGVSAPIGLGGLGVVGIDAGDVDGDGNDDLALSLRSARELWLLRNQRSPGQSEIDSFSLNEVSRVLVGEPNTPAPNNFSTPVLADLDGDGDLDFLQAVEDEDVVVVQRNQEVLENLQRYRPALVTFEANEDFTAGFLKIILGNPLQPPPGATHVEVVVWRRNDALSEPEQFALLREYYPIVPTVPLELELTLPTTSLYFTEVYPIEIGLVRLNPQSVATSRFPVLIHDFVMNDTSQQQVESLESWGPTTSVTPITTTPTEDPQNPGGFVPRSKVGPFTDSELPRPRPQ